MFDELIIMTSSSDIWEPEFVLDIQPYQFEPCIVDSISESESDESGDDDGYNHGIRYGMISYIYSLV